MLDMSRQTSLAAYYSVYLQTLIGSTPSPEHVTKGVMSALAFKPMRQNDIALLSALKLSASNVFGIHLSREIEEVEARG